MAFVSKYVCFLRGDKRKEGESSRICTYTCTPFTQIFFLLRLSVGNADIRTRTQSPRSGRQICRTAWLLPPRRRTSLHHPRRMDMRRISTNVHESISRAWLCSSMYYCISFSSLPRTEHVLNLGESSIAARLSFRPLFPRTSRRSLEHAPCMHRRTYRPWRDSSGQ